ncbi:hypothetical protein K504DRAFT_462102 [Pleomassaria siparia CBS 279.74]|uniref:Uncharacterized protein n=1 Tax=Pleomassaria siparia CBS 279.74 TaxID=1314801 RepID=A0A6G1KMH3_9PLEO|nr:hypothetical protein K504DRAFT_462102 [Pleomassaria siparia CBS 279.74]
MYSTYIQLPKRSRAAIGAGLFGRKFITPQQRDSSGGPYDGDIPGRAYERVPC